VEEGNDVEAEAKAEAETEAEDVVASEGTAETEG